MLLLLETREAAAAGASPPDENGSGGDGKVAAAGAVRHARLPGGLVAFDIPGGAAEEGAAPPRLDGAPLPRPVCAFAHGPAEAPRRLLIARVAPADPAPCLALHPGAAAVPLGPPLPPAALLRDGRDAAERLRLLHFLVATCAGLFRLRGEVGFAALCHAFARAEAGRGGAAARPLLRLGGGEGALSLWAVPPAAATDATAWHLLTRRGLRRLAPPTGRVLVIDGPPPPPDALLLPPPATGLPPLPLAPARPDLPGLHGLVRGPQGAAVLAALAARADAGEGRAATLLREVATLALPARPRRLADPARPVAGALEFALDDHGGGVLLRGWLRDPLGLVAGLALRGAAPGGAAMPLPPAALHRVARPDLAKRFAEAPHGDGGLRPGLLAHLPAVGGGAGQWRLDLRLASGEAVELVAPPGLLPPAAARDLALRAVDPAALRPGLLADCLAPAVARLQAATLRAAAAAGAPERLDFGRAGAARRPAVAVVVPLYRALHFLRFQIAAFARDPEVRRDAALVYVLDSPEQRAEAEHLLRGLSALHDLPLTLLVQPANTGYAAACNAGAGHAGEAPAALLMLNSDVVPAAPGWLGAMRRRLARDRRLGAVGPKLLFADGSVQHAGLYFRRPDTDDAGEWFNDHYAKGFPRHHPDTTRARRVPGVTGAALLVRRDAFAAAGGFCTDYVIGDYEDSDLCLRLRAAGHEIAYEPAAELWHFERQSIARHAGHARTLAAAYNRRLHHARWSDAIAALMARFPGAEG